MADEIKSGAAPEPTIRFTDGKAPSPNRPKKKTEEEIKEEKERQIEEEAAKQRAKYFEGINLEEAYLGKDFVLTDKITIHLPTVQEIIEFNPVEGPQKFWSFLTTFCANPTSMRLMLHELGMKWYFMKDWELFLMLVSSFTLDQTRIFFGDLDFTKLMPVEIIKNIEEVQTQGAEPVKEIVLVYQLDPTVYIDEAIYTKMVNYLRAVFDYHPKVEKPATKTGAQWMLEMDKDKIKAEKRERALHPTNTSFLLPLLSFFFKAYPGWRPEDMDQMNYFFFMDGVRRAQEFINSEALMHGMYSGMLDLNHKKNKKLKKDLNLLKNLY